MFADKSNVAIIVLSIHIMCFNTVFYSKISTEVHLVCICVPGHTKYILRAVLVLSTGRQALTDCKYWIVGLSLVIAPSSFLMKSVLPY